VDEGALAAAIAAIKDGKSARQGLRDARAAGLSIRDSTWFRLVGRVRTDLADTPREMTAPLNRRPLSPEIEVFETRGAEGYLHQVTVYVVDRETGDVIPRPYSITDDFLMKRQDVIDTAIDAFQQHADAYGESIIGAAYTGTWVMVPTLN
jgi:hypothetical protein